MIIVDTTLYTYDKYKPFIELDLVYNM